MTTNTSVANQWIKRLPFAMILLAVIAALTFAFLNNQPVVRFGSSVTGSDTNIQSSIEADAARYTAMAEFYTSQREGIQLGIEANAAQYTAMAEFYSAWRDAFKQTHEADAARYTAMAKFYSGK